MRAVRFSQDKNSQKKVYILGQKWEYFQNIVRMKVAKNNLRIELGYVHLNPNKFKNKVDIFTIIKYLFFPLYFSTLIECDFYFFQTPQDRIARLFIYMQTKFSKYVLFSSLYTV